MEPSILLKPLFGFYIGLVVGSQPYARLSAAVALTAAVAWLLGGSSYHLALYAGWLVGYFRAMVQRLRGYEVC
jgi:hypothetical protein